MSKQKALEETLFRGARLVTPQGIRRQDFAVHDGRIRFPQATGLRPASSSGLDLSGRIVAPGFVDIHFHGYNLFEFTEGLFDPVPGTFAATPSAYAEGFTRLRRALPRFGVTGFYLASWAAPLEKLRGCFRLLKKEMDARRPLKSGSRLLGGLLEGSFINPAMAGAQNPRYVLEPDLEAFERIEDEGCIRLVNVAPDFGAASVEMTRRLTGRGIVVGAGHTSATARQVREAMDAGLSYLIHFTNGPTGSSSKPFDGGGVLEAGLTLETLFLELILDGFHVNPLYIRDILARRGFDRIVAVTDAMYAAGSALKEVEVGGVRGIMSGNGDYCYVSGKPNTLCSSVLTMDRAFCNLLNWLTVPMAGIWNARHAPLSFEEALVACARICSTNPCALTGLAAEGFGVLQEGAPADFTVLRIEGEPGRYSLAVEKTFVGGESVFE